MITVWCMNTNNHAPQTEVDILERMVDRHLSLPHEFICITEGDLPGWWNKVRLYGKNSRALNLWLDLDTVITGPLDGLVLPLTGDSQLRIAKNWARSGHGGCQSSVVYWEGDSASVINDTFDPAVAHWPPRTDIFWPNGQVQHGDQCWTTYLRDTGQLKVEYFATEDVISYKYHCRGVGLPKDAKVVAFHGKPDPYEVNDQWVLDARA